MSSIFDIFSDQPAKDAAAAQTAGLNTANAQATGNINSAIGGLNTNYTAALQPFLTNYGQAQQGTTALGNVLGLNGQGGSDAALTALRNTPGYKFQQGTLDDTVNAAAAANGTLNSGNQLLALNKVNQGLADSTYGQYVSQLQPYLGASGAAAGGIAGVNTGLGNATAGQYDQLAGLNYQTQTGIGNANANADLAAYNASGNFWNMLGGIGSMATKGGGTVGGNLASGIGSAASTAAGGIGDAISSALPMLAMFSDERLKEFIEPVGELYDGTNVYRYNYKGDPTPRIGLMAQEVEKTNPDAVIEIGGYKAVNYGKATQLASDLARFLEAA
jgi:hypothetical protein